MEKNEGLWALWTTRSVGFPRTLRSAGLLLRHPLIVTPGVKHGMMVFTHGTMAVTIPPLAALALLARKGRSFGFCARRVVALSFMVAAFFIAIFCVMTVFRMMSAQLEQQTPSQAATGQTGLGWRISRHHRPQAGGKVAAPAAGAAAHRRPDSALTGQPPHIRHQQGHVPTE